jgi:hypothetical protein
MRSVLEELNREQADLGRRKDAVYLLQSEEDKADAKDNPEYYWTRRIPSPCRAGQSQDHLEEGKYDGVKCDTNPVNQSNPCPNCLVWALIEAWEQDEKNWRAESCQWEVDIERPSPGSAAACKPSSYNWTHNASCPPAEA